tara:strand:+ start:2916 stop:3674 length:759 start_codon:yes stop_codon:yes gene_type:complete
MKLSEKIKKLEFLDRFSLFEVPNFLEEVIYKDLNATYPDASLFSAHNDFAKSLMDDNDNFANFLEKNDKWKIFIEKLNTKLFAEDLIKLFNLKNVYFSKNNWKKNIPNFKKVKLSFCFNISEEGGYSLPHTDSTRKLVSMVLFFVDNAWSEKNGGQVKLYKPKNLINENNWRNHRIDKENLEVIKTIAASPNKIYGFKKTKNSYHSVEPVRVIDRLCRKVLMINLIYEKKSDSPYHQKISIIEKIKKKLVWK